MKLPEDITTVEVWSNTLFFMQGKVSYISVARRLCGSGKLWEAVDRITALMDVPKGFRGGCWWSMSPEEFESITEGIDYEMPRRDG